MSDQLLDEIANGEGETLTELAKRVPRTRQGKSVTLSCLLRWVLNGVRGPSGDRVKLEAVRLGGRWVSSPGALRRFILAQTPVTDHASRPRTLGRRQRASERAARKLEQAGI